MKEYIKKKSEKVIASNRLQKAKDFSLQTQF